MRRNLVRRNTLLGRQFLGPARRWHTAKQSIASTYTVVGVFRERDGGNLSFLCTCE